MARALAERGMAVMVNHGPGEEALTEAVRTYSGGVAIPLKCSVGELIALMRRARLFVGGDTGPMHLAAALKVSGGCLVRSDSTGAQRAFRHSQRCPSQSGECGQYDPHRPSG